MEEEDERGRVLSSSPETLQSPLLPVSYGVGCQSYVFSSSAESMSPPFSSTSTQDSDKKVPSVFSLDHKTSLLMSSQPDKPTSSCLHLLLEWIFQRCCGCIR
ncbi:PREDICTED: uncharacterized protein LOC104815764 [Tarenaya hassleriana]|uniref:uncharacterized protein LOC104815764 n=1 Tax=Tarenaya hassleriana TaxID=28532 RepID=UPI00053C8D9E|nr:PREDICTED: uncharacterized protein LOC104815764 [Tarenaya hassleriana]